VKRRNAVAFLATLPLASRVQCDESLALVLAEAGALPLLLTAPHGGVQAIPGIPARVQGTTVRDAGTSELVERVAAGLHERLGRRPYVVVARFSRRFLDANRPQPEAMESPDALPVYRAYHGRIAEFVAEMKSRFPRGALLLDMHGQGRAPDTIFRGTRDGLTVRALLARHGPGALQGADSLIGLLASKGYRVDPPIGSESRREDRRFDGGHTVATYGSHHAGGIDAMQLEFGRHLRADARLPTDVADALVAFLSRHGMLTT
jgi:N-formylglutamate amidohydrolase